MKYEIIDKTECECGGMFILPLHHKVYYTYPLQADTICNKCGNKKRLHIAKKKSLQALIAETIKKRYKDGLHNGTI